jgi:polar amino acid transport system permease protein
MTLYIFGAVLGISTAFGFLLVLLHRLNRRIVNIFIGIYSWIFRGLPELVILLFCYLALPRLGLKISPFGAAVLGFSVVGVAYEFEIFKGGFEAVHHSQYEACRALGIPFWHMIRRIIVPQILRVILPPYITYATGALKRTSIASAVAVAEIMGMAKRIMTVSYRPFETIFLAMILYGFISSVLMVLEIVGNRYFGRAFLRRY